jgi:hypothetical protein
MEDKELTEEEMDAMATVPSDEEQKRIQDALGPRRSAKIDIVTDEEEQLAIERAIQYSKQREKRNPVPFGSRRNIGIKRSTTSNMQKASRKANRGK